MIGFLVLFALGLAVTAGIGAVFAWLLGISFLKALLFVLVLNLSYGGVTKS